MKISSNQKELKKGKLKRFFNWICKNIYSILHFLVFVGLTIYVILNWQLCISMQFFSKFDGNNILFIVWIALIFLMIYDVEAKDIKLNKHKMKEKYESADRLHTIDELLSQNKNQTSDKHQEGEINNGSSNKNDDCRCCHQCCKKCTYKTK